MKRKSAIIAGLLVLLLLAVSACGAPAGGSQEETPGASGSETQANETGDSTAGGGNEGSSEPIATLRFANFFPAPSGQGKIGEEFAKDIERVTGGKVKVEYYPGGTLLGPADIYDGVVQGIADIGLSNLGYTFGRFPETEMLDLPLGFPNAWVANHVAVDFYEKYAPAEWNDTHVLTLHTSPVNNIITKAAPVKRLEDLRGLTIRGTGYIARFVEALGATARPVAMPESYDNLSKNVIDGLMIPYETTVTFKFGEVTNYVTEVWPLGQVYTFYLVMNKDTWAGLPADVQETITEYVETEFRDKLTTMWNEVDITGYEYAKEAGYEFTQLAADELRRWQEVADKVIDDYVRERVAAGQSEEELRERLDFIRERIDYWTEQQKAEGVLSSTGPDEVRVD